MVDSRKKTKKKLVYLLVLQVSALDVRTVCSSLKRHQSYLKTVCFLLLNYSSIGNEILYYSAAFRDSQISGTSLLFQNIIEHSNVFRLL